MKYFITSLLFLFIYTTSIAQDVQLTSYTEHTIVGAKVGTSVRWKTQQGIEIGAFYQHQPDALIYAEDTRSRLTEREFYGLEFGYPMFRSTYLDLIFATRVGAQNKKNFLITPSIKTYVKPLERISIVGGIGARGFMPTGLLGLQIRL